MQELPFRRGQRAPTLVDMQPDAQAQPDAQPAQSQTRRQVTVQEAARLLDTTVEGVRSRIKRGSLDSIRVSGTVFVLLDDDQASPGAQSRPDGQPQPGAQSSPDSALERVISDQQDQIEFLRRELERKDTILMSLVQRVPELEAPREPREESVSASEEQGDGERPQDKEHRSWWRQLFG